MSTASTSTENTSSDNKPSPGFVAAVASLSLDELREKTRVHELAKLLSVTSKELVAELQRVGIESLRPQSSMTKAQVAEFIEAYQKGGDKAAPKQKKTTKASSKAASKTSAKAASKKTQPKKTQTKKTQSKATESKATEPAATEPAETTAKDAAANSDNEDNGVDVLKRTNRRGTRRRAESSQTSSASKKTPQKRSKKTDTSTADDSSIIDAVRHSSGLDDIAALVDDAVNVSDEPVVSTPPTEPAANAAATPLFIAPDPEALVIPDDTEPTNETPAPTSSRGSNHNKASHKKHTDAPSDDDKNDDDAQRRRRHRRGRGSKPAGENNAKKTKDNNDQHDKNNHAADQRKSDSQGHEKKNQQDSQHEAPADTPVTDEPVGIKGSTRLEAARRRRQERRADPNERRSKVTTQEFIARRASTDRSMIVRERMRRNGKESITQIAIFENDKLVEHFITTSSTNSLVGNVYIGRVQNVLATMEAAFVDIGQDRNAVLYAGDINWRALRSKSRERKIERVLKPGDPVLVQVTKDAVGHKGARLTQHISLAGRFLVYVPEGRTHGISRRLPDSERKRLKKIMNRILPEQGGAIIRTAAEGVSEEELAADVDRMHLIWEDIQEAEANAHKENDKGSKNRRGRGRGHQKKGAELEPVTIYEEPSLLIKVVRDLFNEDFNRLIIEGDGSWTIVSTYINHFSPQMIERMEKYDPADHDGKDAFDTYGVEEQLSEAMARTVMLPSGGSLVIDRTEAMTVIDVNTGRFVGAGGDLEETVTRNNIEAAEEIVRQLRLRDIGGMIVVDFIDMVLPENRDLVIRRLNEYLAYDRTRHQVGEVTSLGLVQITRKRLGPGLLETFSTPCHSCHGRGLVLHDEPVSLLAGYLGLNGGEDDDSDDLEETSRDDHDAHDHDEADTDADDKNTQRDTRRRSEDRPDRKDKGASSRSSHKDHHRSSAKKNSETEPAHDSLKSIEDIVAAAVIVADEVDPDEPSGRDYVPADTITDSNDGDDRSGQSGRSTHRRRTRRRPANQNAEGADRTDSQKSEKTEEKSSQGTAASSTRGGSRRPRRAVRRQMTKPQTQQDKGQASSAPEASPASTQGEEKKASTSRSYAEAKEAFDSSPRRKRQTRGNSRSDIAPKKSDYAAESNQNHAPQTSKASSTTAESAPPTTAADSSDRETTGSRRSGKRVAKRAVRRRLSSASTRAQQTTTPTDERTEAPAAQPEKAGSERTGKSGQGSRRRSSGSSANAAATAEASSAPQSAGPDAQQSTTSAQAQRGQRRGRRVAKRAVKRVKQRPAQAQRGGKTAHNGGAAQRGAAASAPAAERDTAKRSTKGETQRTNSQRGTRRPRRAVKRTLRSSQ